MQLIEVLKHTEGKSFLVDTGTGLRMNTQINLVGVPSLREAVVMGGDGSFGFTLNQLSNLALHGHTGDPPDDANGAILIKNSPNNDNGTHTGLIASHV